MPVFPKKPARAGTKLKEYIVTSVTTVEAASKANAKKQVQARLDEWSIKSRITRVDIQ